MKVDIYQASNYQSKGIVLPRGADVNSLPDSIQKKVGKLYKIKTITIKKDDASIGANPERVINEINDKGYSSLGISINFTEKIIP